MKNEADHAVPEVDSDAIRTVDELDAAIRRRAELVTQIDVLNEKWEDENRKIVDAQHRFALARSRHPSGGRFSNPTAPL